MPERGNGVWKRFLLGAFLIVVAAASATSVAAFHEVNRVVNAFSVNGQIKGINNDLATADPGKPQTIMLLGSDKRAKTARDFQGGSARSDTIILIRLDPSKQATALLSIPRDLKVAIPGPRHRQDQRGLQLRRREAHARDRQAAHRPAHQPRDQHGLPGLRGRGERARLRVPRHRPQVLQLGARVRQLRRDQPPARLPAALRAKRALVRALPPHGLRHRARGPPAGVPLAAQAAGQLRQADRRPRQAAQHLRPRHAVGHPRHGAGHPAAQARGRLGRPPGAGGAGHRARREPGGGRAWRRELRHGHDRQDARTGAAVHRRQADPDRVLHDPQEEDGTGGTTARPPRAST